MNQMDREELDYIIELHGVWLKDNKKGKRAVLIGIRLEDRDLTDVNLSGATLSGCNLCGTKLHQTNLSNADLRDSDFDGAELVNTNLSHADLRGASFIDASLTDVKVDDANFSGVTLDDTKMHNIDLRQMKLDDIKADMFKVLDTAPNEVAGVLLALREGRINGSVYIGECCCLIGTIANLRACNYRLLGYDSNRPAEVWFLMIKEGETPETSVAAEIAAEWIEEWIANHTAEGKMI
jgi:hypothetical protein